MAQNSSDFYEDDEPTEVVVAAFERGTKQVTAPPGTTFVAWMPGVSTVNNEPRLDERRLVQV